MTTEQAGRIVFGPPYERFAELPPEAMPHYSLAGHQGGDVPLESPFQLFIFQHALDRMWQHVRESPHLECAGGLFGHPFIKPDEVRPVGIEITFVIVAVAVPYEAKERSGGHVRITADAIAKADEFVAREHAGLRPVGWYHSHPGLGIFLSSHDSVITASIFNADWHVAIVLDPGGDASLGIFRGPQQERVAGYRVLRELPTELGLMQRYNRACDYAELHRWPEAYRAFQSLQKRFIAEHRELTYWRDKPTYRDLDEWLQRIETVLGAGAEAPALTAEALPEDGGVSAIGTDSRVVRPRPIHERLLDCLAGLPSVFRLPWGRPNSSGNSYPVDIDRPE